MKTIVIIPCRYASTRLAGKPLALIEGQPMIRRVYERCRRAAAVDDVWVATDDRRIIRAVEAFGGQALMTSTANRSGTDRVAEAADKLGLGQEDIIINIQGDQPLVDPRCLDQVAAPLVTEPQIGMSTLAFKIIDEREKTDPKDVKVVIDQEGFALYFSRAAIPHAREASETHDMFKHLGVYAYTLRFLEIYRHLPMGRLERIERLEQLRALEHGHRIKVVITAYDSPEVDLPEDIARIEARIVRQGKA